LFSLFPATLSQPLIPFAHLSRTRFSIRHLFSTVVFPSYHHIRFPPFLSLSPASADNSPTPTLSSFTLTTPPFLLPLPFISTLAPDLVLLHLFLSPPPFSTLYLTLTLILTHGPSALEQY
jgi:hypothetical protein